MPDADLHAARSQYGGTKPALGDDSPQCEHRRVGREDDELPAVRRQLEPAVERVVERGHDLDPFAGEAAVAEAQRQLRGAVAGGDEPLEPVEQRLEVDVPDPRDVPAVRDRVVQRDDGDVGAPPSTSVRTPRSRRPGS